ncbi:MAG TPA: polysaccharide biosynthesis protein [Candidatus Anaerobutyricum avicola]|nr:polysaccharide biosynthesis protein [Candidatus Anaerobutyricum avicola]
MGRKSTSEKNVLAQASILMAAGILVRIIGVLYRSPVTSIIGDEGNGYYSIAYNIYAMVLLISSYSIPMAVSKVVSGKLALKQYKEAHKVFRCALIYVLIVGAIASLFTFFGASILVPDSQTNAIPVLRVLAPAIFLSGFLGVLRGYFQAHSTMMPTSISQIIEQVLNAIISIGAALLFIRLFAGDNEDGVPVFGAMGSAAGIVAGVAAGLIFMIFIYRQNRPYFHRHYMQDAAKEESSYREIFRIIFLMITPVILSTFVYNISTTIDQTIFMDVMDYKGMLSDTAAALYGVFSGKYWVLINVPVALANSMSTAMIPAVSSAYTIEDYEECNAQVKQAIHFTMMISIPSAVGLSVLAYPVMQVLFPQKATIDLAVMLLHIGCISVVFYSLSTITNGVLQGIGKVNVPLRNAALSLFIHVLVLAGLLYFTNMDLLALIFATMLYAFLMCLLNSISVRKYLGYRQEVRKTFVIPAIAAAGMGVLCYIFYQGLYFILGGALGAVLPVRLLVFVCLMVSIAFAVLVYFVLLLKLKGVSEQELRNFPKGHVLVRYAKRFGLL